MPRRPRGPATELLSFIRDGSESLEALLPIVYSELRALAARHMAAERGNHTLQPTALVHEAFMRLVGCDADVGDSRGHFLAIAGRAMRNLLVDHARSRGREKRGGRQPHVTLAGIVEDGGGDLEILDLHAALDKLAGLDERQAKIVEMSYFAGMTGDEIAAQLDIHRNTVVRELRMARAWLRNELTRTP
jgi:RNA polymerase sigma factor (TIGR02999 family)